MLDSRRNPSQRAKNKQQGSEDPWFAVSLRPENFIPGLIVGFLLGLLMDFSRPTKPKSLSNNPSKRQQLASNVGADEELKMVLVVRQDLKMGAGKIASQCAHAATGMYAEFMQSHRSLLRQWEQCGQPKIVVTCKNQQEMNKLKQVADSIGLPTFVVADAGRTQVMAGSKTVLAIGPGTFTVCQVCQMTESTPTNFALQFGTAAYFVPLESTLASKVVPFYTFTATGSGRKSSVDSVTGKLRLL